MKNIIGFISAFSIFLLPVGNAYADDKYNIVDTGEYKIVYFLDENSNAVITEINSEVKDITVPEEINGFKVTGIDRYAFFENTELNSVIFPETLETIGDYAFAGCLSIKNITIPKNVNSVGKGCFLSCTELEKISVKGNIKEIPDNCFASCTKLNYADIPFSVTDIGEKAFFGCTSLNDIALHKNITSFGDSCLGAYYDARLGDIAYKNDFTIHAEKNSEAEKYADEKSLSFSEIKKGDLNGDGKIDSGDASDILAEYSRLSTNNSESFSPVQKIASDLDDNFMTDSSDASEVLKIYASSQTAK